MAKQTQYPRKLRQKLEQVKSAREQREAEEAEATRDETHPAFRTFWRSFYPRNSLHAMYAWIDDANNRIVAVCQMRAVEVPRIRAQVPWDSIEPDASA